MKEMTNDEGRMTKAEAGTLASELEAMALYAWQARANAKRAWRRGDIEKWSKWNAVARVWTMARARVVRAISRTGGRNAR